MSDATFVAAAADGVPGLRVVAVYVTPPDSYPADGVPITAADIGLREILAAAPVLTFPGSLWMYDQFQQCLRSFWVANEPLPFPLAQVDAGLDFSSDPFTMIFFGLA